MPTKDAPNSSSTPAAPAGRAPLIIFGTMVTMSVITVAIVFYTHSQRTEPYLQSKKRRVHYVAVPQSHTLSLNYNDFGPQAMAYELIGHQWWQWQSSGGDIPAENYDIKVIVYRGASVQELTERFPLIKEKKMDPRYLKYEDAIAYLDKHIADTAQPALRQRLQATRSKLLAHFEAQDPASSP